MNTKISQTKESMGKAAADKAAEILEMPSIKKEKLIL